MSDVTKSAGFALAWGAAWNYEDEASGKGGKLSAGYEDDADGWEGRLPAFGTAPPSEVGDEFAAFALQKRSVVREGGDKVVVRLSYESQLPVDEDPETGEPIPRYSMQVSLGGEPILTHERYATLSTTERLALRQIISGERWKTEEGKEQWKDDISSEAGLECLEKIEKGTTEHREPGLIWRERKRIKWTDLNTAADLGNVRRIQTPSGGAPTGGSRNYMYLGPQVEQDESGEYADIQKEWELSGANGWDEDLYAAPA